MKKSLIIGLFVTILSSCASFRTTITQDPNASLSQINRYCWIEGCDGSYQGTITKYFSNYQLDSIKSYISQNLQAKGWKHDTNQAEVLVGFYVIVSEQAAQDRVYDPYTTTPGQAIDYWKAYGDYQEMNKEYYAEGTLVIDIIDANSLSAIWQSKTKRFLSALQSENQKRMKSDIQTALKDL